MRFARLLLASSCALGYLLGIKSKLLLVKLLGNADSCSPDNTMTPRQPLNLNTFFRLLQLLAPYASHYVSQIFDNLYLNNGLSNVPKLYTVTPIPLKDQHATSPTFCSMPFKAELEVLGLLWEPHIAPFMSLGNLKIADIQRFSVRIGTDALPKCKQLV
jgi:hypothetical protein